MAESWTPKHGAGRQTLMPAYLSSATRRLGHRAAALQCGAVVVLTLLGAIITWEPGAALALLGVAAVVFLQSLGWRILAPAIVASTFFTRPRLEVFGLHFLPEHVVLAACLLALILDGRIRTVTAAATDRAVVLFGLFVVWSGAVSVLRAPNPGESLQIVGWLALDWLMLVTLIASTNDPNTLARHGVRWLGVAAAAAVVLWVAATLGLTSFGVQIESTFGAVSAYGLSYESNILAATLALWLFLALTDVHRVRTGVRVPVVVLAAAGIALSLTRAALIGLAAGLLMWAILCGRRGRGLILRTSCMAALLMAVLLALAPRVASPIVAKSAHLVDFGSGTGQLRVSAWSQAVGDLNGADWLVGLGSNSFGQRHLEPTRPDFATPAYLGNLPLQIVYDSGVVGTLLLCAALASVVPWRPRRRAARAVGLLVLYLTCAIATSPFWFGTTWVLMAMAVIDRRRHEIAITKAGQLNGSTEAPSSSSLSAASITSRC